VKWLDNSLDGTADNGLWSPAAVANSHATREALSGHAARLGEGEATSEATLLRETLLVVSAWARPLNPKGWEIKAARFEEMVTLGSTISAAVELLPDKSQYHAKALDDGGTSASITLADPDGDSALDSIRAQCDKAGTVPLAILSALFLALARYIEFL